MVYQGEIRVLHVVEGNHTHSGEALLERESEQFTVETLLSADSGLAEIKDRPPDCVVLEYNDSDMNVVKFIEIVRQEFPDLPLILCTDNCIEDIASDAFGAGVADVVQKRSDPEQHEFLANRVRNAVERHRSEHRLHEIREEYTTLFENVQTGLLLVDVEDHGFRYQKCNTRAAELIGRDHKEIANKSPRDALGPENGKKIVGAYRKCIETCESFECSTTVTVPAGDVTWKCKIIPVNVDDEVEQLVVEFHDVTDRAERQRELERYNRMSVGRELDTLHELFYVLDTDGAFRRWSAQFSEVTGYAESELDGMHATELFPEDEQETVADSIEKALAGERVTVEADILTDSGGRKPYEFTGHQLTDADENTIGLVGIGRDLTEIREQQRRFRALTEQSPDLISVVDTKARFQYASPSWSQLGYDPEELVGDIVWEYVHPDDRADLIKQFEASLTDPSADPVAEFRVRHADGSWRWLEARGNNQLDNPAVEGYVVNKRDITERKQRERELQRKETVFESTRDAIFLIDVVDESEFRIVRVNPAYTDATGFTNKDIGGKTPQEIFGKEVGRRIEARYRECIQRTEPIEYDETLIIDGETTTWQTTLAPVEEDGTVEYLVGATRDVTDKRERMQELSELQEAVETILKNVPVVLFSFNEDGIFTRSQGSGLSRLGLESGDSVGVSVFEMFGDQPEIPGYCERALDGEQVQATVEAGDGIFEVWLQPLRNDCDVTGVVGIGYDITERKERERELLRKSRALESAPVGITMSDPNREDNPIIFANKKHEEITGYSESETCGWNHRHLQGERTKPEPVTEMREAIDEREEVSVELRNYRKDSTEFWNQVGIAPVFDEGGELVNFVGFQQDVTERKQREQQIQVFNRILRHNLRNRLNVARAYVERAASEHRGRVGEPGEFAAESAAIDRANLEPALNAIEDLIDLSDKSKELHRAMNMNAKRQDIELGSYLSSLIEEVRESFPESSLSFEQSEDVVLSAFPSLRVALQEILQNAAEHAGPKPSISVVVNEKVETVEIQISDNGQGLSEQDQQVLAEGSETPLMHGSGLGLWMVSWIVTSHGGSLEVDVSQDGTTVTVSLPQSSTETGPVSVVSEPELQQARDRFETIFEESFDAMVISDPDGNYIEVNAAATELFGRTERQLAGSRLEEFAEDLDRPQVKAAMESGVERDQFMLVWPDGTERFVEYSITPNIVSEQHLFVFRDITERKRREQVLTARTEELERQNDRLNEFASLVSHDLRNPLNVATKQLEQARAQCKSDHLSKVAAAHRRMDELIGDVLGLARAGRELGDLESVQLTAMVARCWQNVQSKDALLSIKTDCQLRADPRRFRQLVENLLRNAIEHGGDDISITVSQREDGDGFYVADDGPGIPTDERNSIFESGYSTEIDGTGFGLAIVEEIVDAHGWSIRVSESENGGVRFDITDVLIS